MLAIERSNYSKFFSVLISPLYNVFELYNVQKCHRLNFPVQQLTHCVSYYAIWITLCHILDKIEKLPYFPALLCDFLMKYI